jgi:hypothetical protein
MKKYPRGFCKYAFEVVSLEKALDGRPTWRRRSYPTAVDQGENTHPDVVQHAPAIACTAIEPLESQRQDEQHQFQQVHMLSRLVDEESENPKNTDAPFAVLMKMGRQAAHPRVCERFLGLTPCGIVRRLVARRTKHVAGRNDVFVKKPRVSAHRLE